MSSASLLARDWRRRRRRPQLRSPNTLTLGLLSTLRMGCVTINLHQQNSHSTTEKYFLHFNEKPPDWRHSHSDTSPLRGSSEMSESFRSCSFNRNEGLECSERLVRGMLTSVEAGVSPSHCTDSWPDLNITNQSHNKSLTFSPLSSTVKGEKYLTIFKTARPSAPRVTKYAGTLMIFKVFKISTLWRRDWRRV